MGDEDMYTSISEFIAEWKQEAESTQRVLDALTDQSLQQEVSPNDRTLGRVAWHIVTSTPGMLTEFGLSVQLVEQSDNVPTTAKKIADTFRTVSKNAAEAVGQQWTDESLKESKEVFFMKMQKAGMLSLLVKHIIHHRGQMTILMRQAGLQVPGIYGPAREEWSKIGMEAPKI
jgi:uncharacterized damage-inducible protein DinB